MEISQLPWDIEFIRETVYSLNDSSWMKLYPNLDFRKINPIESAADFYLLTGIIDGVFVDSLLEALPTRDALAKAAKLLKLDDDILSKKITEVEYKKTLTPEVKLADYIEQAKGILEPLVDKLDLSFREYLHLACGGELRHAQNISYHTGFPGERRVAWAGWYYIHEKYGTSALDTMVEIFRDEDIFESGYGGGCWADAAEVLMFREMGTLGPDDFSNKKFFVDRVFSLEHNNGCILTKLRWKNFYTDHAEYEEALEFDDDYDREPPRNIPCYNCTSDVSSMRWCVLEAHSNEVVDIKQLYLHASEGVQQLVQSYMTSIIDNDFGISGIWKRKLKVKMKDPTPALPKKPEPFDWSSFEPPKEITTDVVHSSIVSNFEFTAPVELPAADEIQYLVEQIIQKNSNNSTNKHFSHHVSNWGSS